ncbi:phage baseplate assembly protein V [Ottowia sp.]|uniref:phage baseplate assembly protein V n=1 Tax=Ottowia sp. TaxID=1898956 RepID=UPI003A897A64
MLPDTYNPEADPQDAARVAGMMLRTGTVAEVDVAKAMLRFATGDITTDWLPWLERRAGGTNGGRTWWPPVVGEQGILLAPGGDLARAVVLPGMFSTAMPAGERTAAVARDDFNAADFWQWENGTLSAECTSKIEFGVGDATLTITPEQIALSAGGATLTLAGGIVTASADVVAGGVSLVSHIHTGVISGPMVSGPPVGGGGGGGGSGSGSGDAPGWLGGTLPDATPAEAQVRYLASYSRLTYRGQPSSWGIVGAGYHYNILAELPEDTNQINEALYYQRVRPSVWRRVEQNGTTHLAWDAFVATAHDPAAGTWADDVLDTARDHIGLYNGSIPAGISSDQPPPPYETFKSSRTGLIYAAIMTWTKQDRPNGTLPIPWQINPRVCWLITDAEWAAQGTPKEGGD